MLTSEQTTLNILILITGDNSAQYVGCYTEVTDPSNQASNANKWIDKWGMRPDDCIQYCVSNAAAFANLKVSK